MGCRHLPPDDARLLQGLLFLGSGSVIHGMGGEQDMRKMGGLRKHMPVTFWTFLIGSAANAGVFPLAGFWSKDEIIVGAWISDSSFGKIAAIMGLAAAFLTALYMFRLVFTVFFGEERFGSDVHPHESGAWMAVPLVIWRSICLRRIRCSSGRWCHSPLPAPDLLACPCAS